jgi:hypothetical protein
MKKMGAGGLTGLVAGDALTHEVMGARARLMLWGKDVG